MGRETETGHAANDSRTKIDCLIFFFPHNTVKLFWFKRYPMDRWVEESVRGNGSERVLRVMMEQY